MNRRFASLLEPKVAVAICSVVSLALLAGAHLFERLGGMPPCLLCLDQREAHWAAVAISLLALPFLLKRGPGQRVGAAALGALVLVYGFGVVLAGYHSGVEWGFWPGPAGCSASGVDLDLVRGGDIFASLAQPSDEPSCSEAAWRLFGISMAGYNAAISLALAVLAGLSCGRAARGLRRDRVTNILAAN